MRQAKLVKRETVAQPKPEQPPAPNPMVRKTLKMVFGERVKTAETARTDARTAFAALFARA